MPPKVQFYFNSTLPHFTQLISGIEILNQQGEIDLEYSLETRNYPVNICRVVYEGKVLIFDLADTSVIREKFYNECDFYIKRMLLRKDFKERNKLIPYGLNYIVFYENIFMRNLIFNKKYFKYGIRYHQKISEILNIKISIYTSHLKNLQAQPIENYNLIFRTRLWNPDNNLNISKKKERKKMNQERIKINQLLTRKFGDSFQGGIEKDEYSTKESPDLLLSGEQYHKKNYLKLLKNSAIGIVSPGLEDSISWKFGEYVAHGLAVITTPVDDYLFRGEFREGENYLVYSELSELVEKIESLHRNDSYLRKIQKNNVEYYKNWLEPSAKIRSIFMEIKAS
ncbi:glycosyltransferase [Salinimicrobium terrae]|uniref:glycosyltransferase n=1 Tax=Salinimicrobium terrae TaxID=470866 RepID=UPI000421700C|nr:glycosyltransferase [Salinimicrobium terrae]